MLLSQLSKMIRRRRQALLQRDRVRALTMQAQVGILHGANDTFCAGFDLHTVSYDNSHADFNNVDRGTLGPMGPSRLQIKKPFICAVSGYAVAGGLELSLLGDIRIAEEDAHFGVFCRRWGVNISRSRWEGCANLLRSHYSMAEQYDCKLSSVSAELWT